MNSSAAKVDIILLSTEPSPPAWLSAWLERAGGGVELREPPGAATLAIVLRRRPTTLILHIGPSIDINICASWILELRQRRPRLPLIVLADAHDPALERALRAAGAQFYACGEAELNAIIAALRQTRSAPAAAHADHTRDPPAPRIRGRPISLSRDSPPRKGSILRDFGPFTSTTQTNEEDL